MGKQKPGKVPHARTESVNAQDWEAVARELVRRGLASKFILTYGVKNYTKGNQP